MPRFDASAFCKISLPFEAWFLRIVHAVISNPLKKHEPPRSNTRRHRHKVHAWMTRNHEGNDSVLMKDGYGQEA
jgi:hypothetical protein